MLVSWAAQLRSLKSCWMQWKFEATTAAVKPTSQHPRTKLLTWKILTSSIQQLSSVMGIGLYYWHKPVYYWESMAGSVIQATGSVEFEDYLWVENHVKDQNGLQRVCTIPWVQPGAVRTPGFLRGQTEFQFAWGYVAAWCWARCQVQAPGSIPGSCGVRIDLA